MTERKRRNDGSAIPRRSFFDAPFQLHDADSSGFADTPESSAVFSAFIRRIRRIRVAAVFGA
jgi:hypothetical protein